MRTRTRAALAAATLIIGSFGAAVPAAAATGSFRARCVVTGIHGPVTDFRVLAYSVSAPDRVAPGETFTLPITIGYSVPANATFGGAGFSVLGDAEQPGIPAAAGAAHVSGALRLTAADDPGGVVTVTLDQVGSLAQFGSFTASEICTPTSTATLARIAIGVPQLSIGDGAVVEGSSGTRLLELPVTLSRPAATAVTAGFATEDATATAGADYLAASGTVTIPAGSVSGIATVRVRGDVVVEPKESFRVRLHDAVGAVLGRAVGTGRIIDDDPEPGPRLSIGDVAIVEGARGLRSARFTVSLSAPLAQDVTFHGATVDGSAVAGVEYRAQDLEFGIPAGHTSITVAVPVLPDATPEPTKSFTVHLSGASGATIGRANGVGTIIDDD